MAKSPESGGTFYHIGHEGAQYQEPANGPYYRPLNDPTGSKAYHGRRARNSSTADLNTRSPTANMWSRPGMTTAFAPGISAARASGEPAIESLSPTATSSGDAIWATWPRLSVCREPRMQAASACKSDLVCSAKARKT